MRIAITVDPYIPVPPINYGGIERVVDFLVRGLLARGHEVVLFAHPESSSPAKLIPYGAPPHSSVRCRVAELWQVGSKLWKLRTELDLVHSFGRLAALLPILPIRSIPKLQSYQRDRLPEPGIVRALRLARGSLRFTACSSHMYSRSRIEGEWTTVFNGVDVGKYDFVSKVAADAPLVFLGRLETIKGAHQAIEIARRARRRLTLAGNVPPEGRAYFEERIEPALDGDSITYIGPVDDQRKNELLGGAAALLMPIQWEEPFGIVMVEAMACGTPVIAYRRGSVPEVVRHGVNGYVCDDLEDAVDAVRRLPLLSREAVRADSERRFASDVVVSAYERLYIGMSKA